MRALPPPSLPRAPLGLLPLFRLALLSTESASLGGRFRSVSMSATLLAVSAVAAVAVAVWVGAGDVSDLLALRLLAYAAWMYGLLGLPALLEPGAAREQGHALARLRGRSAPRAALRPVGLALRLLSGLVLAALPGLVVAAATSEGVRTLGLRLALFGLALLYLALLALTLGVVGALSEAVAPERPRLVAFSLVLGPFVLSLAEPTVPSIPGVFLWLFEQLAGLGGLAG